MNHLFARFNRSARRIGRFAILGAAISFAFPSSGTPVLAAQRFQPAAIESCSLTLSGPNRTSPGVVNVTGTLSCGYDYETIDMVIKLQRPNGSVVTATTRCTKTIKCTIGVSSIYVTGTWSAYTSATARAAGFSPLQTAETSRNGVWL